MPELKAFLAGGGDMGRLIRAHDWGSTPLGPIGEWPQSLRSALSICLRSASPTALYWGPEFRLLYNDEFAPILGPRHPDALGRPAASIWSDIWSVIEGQFRGVLEKGEVVHAVDAMLPMARYGSPEEAYFSYTLLPIAGEDGSIGGILNQARDRTASVWQRRQDALLLKLAETLRPLDTIDAILDAAVGLVGEEMQVGRVGYAEIDEVQGTVSILACWTDGSMADISGTYPLGAFGDAVHEALEKGLTVRVDDVEADPGSDDPGLLRRYAAIQLRAGLVVPVFSHSRYRAALFAQHHQPRRWTDGEEALLRAATDRIWQEATRVRAEVALRHSERRYRQIFEGANDLIFTADLDQKLTDCNPAVAAAMGLAPEAAIGRSIREFVSEEGWAQTNRMLRQKLEHGGTTRHDIEVRAPGGKRMYWEINSSLAYDTANEIVGLHAIARDVTERKRFEERQRLLVNELNHRVKNTLALVQGLALQSFKDGRDMAEAREAFQERLAALARAHDLLTRENWEGVTLDQLVEGATGHQNAAEERIRADGPDIKLNARAAVSLVMALHELCTNAAKYGALSVPGGHVDIEWDIEDDDRLRLEWRERDGPRVEATGRRGFGFRMIERALAADLGGEVVIDLDEAGLVCAIEAPLARAAAA